MVFLEYFNDPIHMTCVLLALIFNPEKDAYRFKISRVRCRHFSVPSSISDVSSANCEMRYSVSPIRSPFTRLSFRNMMLNTSAQIIKIYGDNGSPCLQPLVSLKNSEEKPFTSTLDSMPEENNLIHRWMDGPKPK